MFSNFLYFLIALVIYTTSDLFGSSEKIDTSSGFGAFLVSAAFALVCHLVFSRLERKVVKNPGINADHFINAYITRLSVLALIIFAVDIYGFKLGLLLSGNRVFDALPTLRAILFLGLFLFYLTIVWSGAYQVQKRYFPGHISRKAYILSNVSFSLPALLPWFCLSVVADLLNLLPWAPLSDFLKTPAGEIGYISVFLIAIAVFGPVFIKKLWRCRPLEPGYARTRIEAVCRKAGLAYADILRWDLFGGVMMTAGVMGLVGRFRYILVTPSLLNALDDEEIDSVMLHEIGHVQKHHMLFYLLFFAGFIACNFVFFEPVFLLLSVMEPVYGLFGMVGIPRESVHPILISASLIGFFIFYFRFVFGFFMRNFERQADLHIYRFSPDASPLISTFYKIASYSRQSIEKPSWHHFSIGQRVRFLEKCQQNPELIQAHHSRVKKMILGYTVGVLLVFSIGYTINYGAAREPFGNYIAEKLILQEMGLNPDNSDLYVIVGDYYYSRKKYRKAVDSYENVLRVNPDSVHALNNLSWLYATCPDEAFQNYEKALAYARKAVELTREPSVLDTYAEALFVNREVPLAIAAAKEALTQADSKKAYYQSQLERFEKGFPDESGDGTDQIPMGRNAMPAN